MYTTSADQANHTPEKVRLALQDERRLNALRNLALMDTPREAVFDRLTRLASRLVGAPISLVTLIDHDRAFFKSAYGIPEGMTTLPSSAVPCQHTVAGHHPLIVPDAREVSFLKTSPAVAEMGAVAYLGMPLLTSDGLAFGSFCVIDRVERQWSEDEVSILRDLAETTMNLMEMRAQIANQSQQADSKQRSLMDQIVQADSKRKSLQQSYNATLKDLNGMLEQGAASADIVSYISTKLTP